MNCCFIHISGEVVEGRVGRNLSAWRPVLCPRPVAHHCVTGAHAQWPQRADCPTGWWWPRRSLTRGRGWLPWCRLPCILGRLPFPVALRGSAAPSKERRLHDGGSRARRRSRMRKRSDEYVKSWPEGRVVKALLAGTSLWLEHRLTGGVDGSENVGTTAGVGGLCGTALPSSTGHGFFQGVWKGVVGWFDELGPLGRLPGVAQAVSNVESGLEGRGSSGRLLECLEDAGGECLELLVEDWEGVCRRCPVGGPGGEGGRCQCQSQASFWKREAGNGQGTGRKRGEAKQLFQACGNGCIVAERNLLGQGRGRGTKNVVAASACAEKEQQPGCLQVVQSWDTFQKAVASGDVLELVGHILRGADGFSEDGEAPLLAGEGYNIWRSRFSSLSFGWAHHFHSSRFCHPRLYNKNLYTVTRTAIHMSKKNCCSHQLR